MSASACLLSVVVIILVVITLIRRTPLPRHAKCSSDGTTSAKKATTKPVTFASLSSNADNMMLSDTHGNLHTIPLELVVAKINDLAAKISKVETAANKAATDAETASKAYTDKSLTDANLVRYEDRMYMRSLTGKGGLLRNTCGWPGGNNCDVRIGDVVAPGSEAANKGDPQGVAFQIRKWGT